MFEKIQGIWKVFAEFALSDQHVKKNPSGSFTKYVVFQKPQQLIKTLVSRHGCYGVVIVNFEYISYLLLFDKFEQY